MDGNREDAMMSTVTGLAVDDSGVLYFLDTGNGLLRKLEDGIVSTVAGRKGNLAIVDGKPLESSLKWPYVKWCCIFAGNCRYTMLHHSSQLHYL